MRVTVDIANTFDTLKWPFLSQVLTNFSFSPLVFMDWVSAILRYADRPS